VKFCCSPASGVTPRPLTSLRFSQRLAPIPRRPGGTGRQRGEGGFFVARLPADPPWHPNPAGRRWRDPRPRLWASRVLAPGVGGRARSPPAPRRQAPYRSALPDRGRRPATHDPRRGGFGNAPFSRPERQLGITLARTARHARVAVRSQRRHSILQRGGPPAFAARRPTGGLIGSRTAVFARR
jgi:hypothetical protein